MRNEEYPAGVAVGRFDGDKSFSVSMKLKNGKTVAMVFSGREVDKRSVNAEWKKFCKFHIYPYSKIQWEKE